MPYGKFRREIRPCGLLFNDKHEWGPGVTCMYSGIGEVDCDVIGRVL